MSRTAVWIGCICLLFATTAFAIGIPPTDLDPFTSPCTLAVTENGSTRTLSWNLVLGAATYRVGRIPKGETEVDGLAEVTGTSYVDTTWVSNECYEYVMVAYDSSGDKVCSAHVENVGYCVQ